MTLDPTKGHAALRRGRSSQSGADYFLTLCTENRDIGLSVPNITGAILGEAKAMSADGTWLMHSAVVMPDHLHLLVTLGGHLPLAKTVQRLKAKTSAILRAAHMAWERGFFDRRLRPGDDRLAVLLYIHLNPYRAGLVEESGIWPAYYCREEEWARLQDMAVRDRPMPEWLL